MSWRDRSYAGGDEQPEIRIQFRKPSTAVVWIIVANVAMFFVDLLSQHVMTGNLYEYLGLSLGGIKSLFFWQPLSYMFMHSGVMHLLMNMIGLYIFGTEFERVFGRDRFLQFYGICGIIGGVGYLLLSAFSPIYREVPLVGASGAVYGLLLAAVIFFPHIQVILFIFPVPIRVFGLIVLAILLLSLLTPGRIDNLGGEICHITGAVAGLGVFYAWGIMPTVRFGGGRGITLLPGSGSGSPNPNRGAWEKKQKKLAAERAEVDRILEKVSREGMQSLNWREQRTLRKATQRQQQSDRDVSRM